jgi:putative addiction module component (TIGR02574 family)
MIDINEIRKLSVEERILMVEEIWDSIAQDTSSEELKISEEEKQEIIRRLENHKLKKQKTYSWGEVKQYAKEP